MALNTTIEDDIIRKSPNSRRRRRGSRRHSHVIETSLPPVVIKERRKSSVVSKIEEKDSPAFQSLVDIIHDLKRLPSISIGDKQGDKQGEEQWKRVRRHSEPHNKIKHVDFKKSLRSIHDKPIFSNSFLILEEEGENKEEEKLVSPLEQPKKRSRSSSGKIFA